MIDGRIIQVLHEHHQKDGYYVINKRGKYQITIGKNTFTLKKQDVEQWLTTYTKDNNDG
jgi:predicted transcriptional regulator